MTQLAIIADDLTGAADTSACFADAGYATVIPLGGAAAPAADVVALTTESRDMDAAEAAETVRGAVSGLRPRDGGLPHWIYKKIDSALRGHPRDELFATMDAAGITRALVAPALPAEGRTTVRGRQHIGGVPLEQSSFGRPGGLSDLLQIFANDRGWPVQLLDLETIRQRPGTIPALLDGESAGILLADAETEEDLATLARAAAGGAPRILCGSAGFARQLAPALPLTAAVPRPVKPRATDRPILIVAGSQHGATARQIAVLASAGSPIVRLEQVQIDDLTAPIDATIADVAARLAAGKSTVVTTSGLMPSVSGERSVAMRLAEIATAPMVRDGYGGLVLTGGDVAAAVCQALGATALWLGGEIYAGQPWALLAGGALPGLPVATKAGSFGGDGALTACVAHLREIDATAAATR
ncbi:MAG: four-carbon acid sugar kinase family protein [Thermomicrobiales bacterium]|nr:four-carbon acid sugar kinase family protein [Thermomicrobiales bacterium]